MFFDKKKQIVKNKNFFFETYQNSQILNIRFNIVFRIKEKKVEAKIGFKNINCQSSDHFEMTRSA